MTACIINAKTKQNLIRIVSVALFLTLLLSGYQKISWILQKKLTDDKIHLFYEEPRNSLDVVFVGPSHIYYAMSPMQLWHDYGITSFDAGSPSQAIPVSYYLIREAVRTQHPKVIVLDIFYMFYNLHSRGQGHLHEVSDAMPMFAKNRIDMINDLAPKTEGEETVWSFYFPIAYAHSRWKELESVDFYPKYPYMKGQLVSAQKAEVTFYEPLKKEIPLYDTTVSYLEKIKSFCEESGTELLLVCVPYTTETEKQKTMKRQLSMLKQFEKYAQENGYRFINMYSRMEELGIDTATDFCEAAHVNIYGAEKITTYIGKYLKDNYDLPDHRGEKEYSSWDTDYEKYANRISAVIRNTAEGD